MKVGLHIADFTWDGGPPELGPRLGDIARRAEEAGFGAIWISALPTPLPAAWRSGCERCDRPVARPGAARAT